MAFRQKIGKKKKKKEEEEEEKRVLAFVGHPQWRKMNIYIYIKGFWPLGVVRPLQAS
jgi:hypothetical protein